MINLAGSWAATYSGWQHFHPRAEQAPEESRQDFLDRVFKLPPLIGGYRCLPTWKGTGPFGLFSEKRVPDRFEPREGYFAIAGLLCVTLFPFREAETRGTLTGFERFNRGAIVDNERELKIKRGEWITVAHPDAPSVQIGTIHTVHDNKADEEVQNNYMFVVRNNEEMDWIVYSTHLAAENPETRFRARLAEGTFRRVGPM